MAYSKYFVYKKQVSNDGGQTWADTVPLETTTSGDPIFVCETLAECESSTPKFYAKYNDGTSYMIDCTSTGDTLTSADTMGHSTSSSAMTEAVIGNCVTEIGYCALGSYDTREKPWPASLTSVTISNSVTSIGDRAFQDCSAMTRCDIPNGVTSIGFVAFSSCHSLTSVTIPSGVTVIEQQTFDQCISLTSITIPDNVVRITHGAFYSCSGLTSVVIGSGVTVIDSHAFMYCTSLQSVTIHATTPPTMSEFMGGYPFDLTNNCPIYVPSGSVNAYKTVGYWPRYADRIRAIP